MIENTDTRIFTTSINHTEITPYRPLNENIIIDAEYNDSTPETQSPQLVRSFTMNEKLFIQYKTDTQLKEATAKTYKNAIEQFFRWTSEQNIHRPVKKDAIRFIDYLHDDKQLSASTINLYFRALKSFFTYLVDEHLYDIDITKGVKTPTVRKGHFKIPLTLPQVQDLLAQPDITTKTGRRDYAILNCMLILGLRTIEIQRAKRQDLQLIRDQYRFYPYGKGREEAAADEFMIVPDDLYAIIMESLKDREAVNPEDPLFPSWSNNSLGRPMTSKSVSRMTKSYLRAIGIDTPQITAHSCRHTAITLALTTPDIHGNSITIRQAQQFARHSSSSITEIYAHDLDREHSVVEQTLSSLIHGSSSSLPCSSQRLQELLEKEHQLELLLQQTSDSFNT